MALSDFLRTRLGVDQEIARVRDDYTRVIAARESDMRLLQRQIEELSEIALNVAPDQEGTVISPEQRKAEMIRARRTRASNPLAKRSAKLIVHYTFGDGVAVKAQDEEFIGPLVQAFWDDPDNQIAFTSHAAQTENADRLFTDGDLFIALFVGEDGTVKVRMIPPEEIDDIITHPEDRARPLLYKRTFQPRRYDAAQDRYIVDAPQVEYYRDVNNRYFQIDPESDPVPVPESKLGQAFIYHVRVNPQGKFGSSELFASIPWAKAFKDFMDDRVAINRAAASITHVRKVSGTPAAVKQAADAIPGQYGDSSRWMPNGVGTTRAGWAVSSDAIDDRWLKTDTGATNAIEDARMLLVIYGAGVGIPMHWLGEGGDANLATAAAMNDPVMRQFQAWQKLWNNIYTDVIKIVLLEAVRAGKLPGEVIEDRERGTMRYALATYGSVRQGVPLTEEERLRWERERDTPIVDWVDIDFPPTVPRDVKDELTAINLLAGVLPPGNLEAAKIVARLAFTALGVNDTKHVMDQVFYEGYELPDAARMRAEMQQAAVARSQGMDDAARESLLEEVDAVARTLDEEFATWERVIAARRDARHGG